VQVRMQSRASDGMVVVTVTDNGPGVPDEVRDKLFDPYFTTKTSGTGLGLAICRRLIEAHGGSIRLVSTQAGETQFAIELPIVAP
jgi:signal transduction histidine kinase